MDSPSIQLTAFGRDASYFDEVMVRTMHSITGHRYQEGIDAPSWIEQVMALQTNVNLAERDKIHFFLERDLGSLGVPRVVHQSSPASAASQISLSSPGSPRNESFWSFRDTPSPPLLSEDHEKLEAQTTDEEAGVTEGEPSTGEESPIEGETEEAKDEGIKYNLEKLKECRYCLYHKTLRQFPSKTPTPTCNHEVMCCKSCMGVSLEYQLETTQWHQLVCDYCHTKLPSDVLKEYMDKDTFSRYLDFMSTFRIRNEPDFHWCQKPECNSGQIYHDLEISSKMTCHKCGYVSCIACKVLYHEGQTCEAYQKSIPSETDLENMANLEILQKFTNKCPKCDTYIERDGGCEDMFCGICEKSFEWKETKAEMEKTQITNDEAYAERLYLADLETCQPQFDSGAEDSNENGDLAGGDPTHSDTQFRHFLDKNTTINTTDPYRAFDNFDPNVPLEESDLDYDAFKKSFARDAE